MQLITIGNGSPMRALAAIRYYLQLTKPTIMLLVVITGTAGLVTHGALIHRPGAFILVLLGLFCAGGSANALNQYFERELDARMTRTRRRRPLPQGLIGPRSALAFAIGIGLAGVAIFAIWFNLLSALLALGTILFYGVLYTLWLKPNTAQNIVIGGAAGAMGPVIAWAAAANNLSLTPWLMFLIVFLWTPPHFWALALYLKDDYRKVNLPMMPLVKGDRSTLRQMWWYTLATVAISLALVPLGKGWFYGVAAVLLGAGFVYYIHKACRQGTRQSQFSLFKFSIVYLLALFCSLIVQGMLLNA